MTGHGKIGLAVNLGKEMFKNVPKSMQFTAALPDTKKIDMKKRLADPSLQPWQRRRIEVQLRDFELWQPRKKLSREQMDELRQLNAQDPTEYSFPALSAKYGISFEAVRRIVNSRFSG